MAETHVSQNEFLKIAEQIESMSVPTRRDEEHAMIAHYVNLFLGKLGNERCYIAGSTADRARLRLNRDEADSDFILICGKTVIPVACLEYNKECPCFVSVKVTDVLQCFNVEPIDGCLPAELLRSVHPEAFSLLRIIFKPLVEPVHATGDTNLRDMYARQSACGHEYTELFGTGMADGTSTLTYKSVTSKDYVPCFSLSGPPVGFDLWVYRERLWPKDEVVEDIARSEIFLVAKPAIVNGNAETDFCLSFTVAERRLFNEVYKVPVHRKCYLVIKALHKADLNHQKLLKTFHWKTAFLWISENRTTWKDDNLLPAVMDVLDFMIKSLQSRNLTHFFITSNLFEHLKKDELKAEIDDLILKIQRMKENPLASLRRFLELDAKTTDDVITVPASVARLTQEVKCVKSGSVAPTRMFEAIYGIFDEVTDKEGQNVQRPNNGHPTYDKEKLIDAVIEVANQIAVDVKNKKYFLTPLSKPLLSDNEADVIQLAAFLLSVPQVQGLLNLFC